MISNRVSPHDAIAEAMVLSQCLESEDAIALVGDKLSPEDFYTEPHRRVFEAVLALAKGNAHVDVVSVAGWLRDQNRLAQVGGAAFLAELINAVPAVAHVEEKADRIIAFARARKLIATAQKIAAAGYGITGDGVQAYLEESEREVFDIAQGHELRDVAPMLEVQTEVYRNLVRAEARGHGNVERPTGIVRLDKMVGGLGPSKLYVVAARPSMGKTSLVAGWAETLGELGHVVLFFSLEMSREDIGARMACARAGASVKRALAGWLGDRERADFLHAQDCLKKFPIFIDDTPAVTLLQIRAKARRLEAKTGRKLELIIVDYLQLMTAEVAKGSTRDREIASITAGLKRLARELGCAVVLLSQLNRECESREDKRPRLSDLRESGAIEQDADVIVFVYRDEWYHRATEDKGIAELIIGKQRNGPTGVVRCGFDGKATAFRNLHTSSDEPDEDTEAA